MKLLQAQHASNRNLQFATEDTYGLQAAFDPHWEAGVPYTMVIAPGGKVLYQKQGEVDILESMGQSLSCRKDGSEHASGVTA